MPTHHCADCPIVIADKAIAIATGLNICFFLIAKIYLEAIATIEENEAIKKKDESKVECGGAIRRTKIKAVI